VGVDHTRSSSCRRLDVNSSLTAERQELQFLQGFSKQNCEDTNVTDPDGAIKPDQVITIVVIDDHQLVVETLKTTLSGQAGLSVVGSADTGASGIDLVASLQPTVALIDYRLNDMSGADVVRALAVRAPATRCVILTGSGQDRALLDSLEAGAIGFVTKHQRFSEVVEAVRSAARGEASIPAAMLGKVLPQLRNPEATNRLTEREQSVLELLATGKSNPEIGAELFISVNTVRNHVANLLAKLDAKSRTEAVSIALRQGLIATPGS
jgi:two-component system, NarL family, nitrate/nitrite response regulator NarL